jgi:D-serine deaminase-like pyridoxal phosphate-dependent protein
MPTAPRTPSLVVDPVALDANIAAMQALATQHGVALRPHAKGHRAPWIAARQLAAGAIGVAVATLDEAALFLDAGVGDVLLTTALAPHAAPRIAALAHGGALTVVVHTAEYASAISRAGMEAQVAVPVLLDVDVGQRRGGVPTAAAAVALASDVLVLCPYLVLRGVQGYDGQLQGLRDAEERAAGHAAAMALLVEPLGAIDALVRRHTGEGLAIVTTAGTATAPLAAARADELGITEIQPGAYALMDHVYAGLPGVGYAQAAHVLTRVTAVLGPGEVIVDAGNRAVSSDLGVPRVAGLEAAWESAGDEHGRIRGAVAHLRPGDVLRLIPSHTDTTVVLHGAAALEA